MSYEDVCLQEAQRMLEVRRASRRQKPQTPSPDAASAKGGAWARWKARQADKQKDRGRTTGPLKD